MEPITFTIQAKIQKPRAEVFAAVYDPNELSQYFTTGSSSGPLDEGASVIWRFADCPGDVPVRVTRMVPGESIELTWESGEAGYDTHVAIRFSTLEDGSTLVAITESGWRDTEKGRFHSYQNCQGWTQMTCCLKAYVERGINLREGFY